MRRVPIVLLLAAAAAAAAAAAPAAGAERGSRAIADYVLRPLDGGPVSGLALAQERPRRLRLDVALADSRLPFSLNYEEIKGALSRRRCGDPAGRRVTVAPEHVAGRGLEYTATTRARRNALSDATKSMRILWDRAGDGTAEEVACGNLLHGRVGRRAAAAAKLRPVEGSGVSGLATARQRSSTLTARIVLVDAIQSNEDFPGWELELSVSGGGTFDAGDAAGWDIVRSLRTPARQSGGPIIRRLPTLTLAGDLNGDGAREPAVKGRAEGWVGVGAEAN